MIRYSLKRIGLVFVTTAIIVFMVFAFIRSMPGMKIENDPSIDPVILQKLLERDGIGKGTIIQQFTRWVGNIAREGSLGYSLKYPEEVTSMIGKRLIVTVRINIVPYLISIPIGIGLGIWAALRKNKLTDHIISTGVMVLISVPSFVIGILLQYLFAFNLNWVPWNVLRGSDYSKNIWIGLSSYILPTIMLTVGSVAGLARVSRAELTEVLTSEFMLLCRTKGLNRRQSTIRHGIRNALVPIAPALIGGLVGILSGSFVTEQIFGVFGIGKLYIESFIQTAGTRPDYPVIMALLMFYTLIGLLATLVVDLSYGVIDPRIRMGAGKR